MRAFGISVASDFELPGLRLSEPPTLLLAAASRHEVESAWSSSSRPPVWQTEIDGLPFELLAGDGNDHLMRWGEHPFHLDANATTLTCAPPERDRAAWQRQLLDTVLHTCALVRGADALHAAAVALGTGVVGLLAGSGGGKTTLCCELLSRGYRLLSDDVTVLERAGETFAAHPGPPLMNVPADRFEALARPAGLRPLARLGDEVWAQTERPADGPMPLVALILLERRTGSEFALDRVPASPRPLIGHTLVMANRADRDLHLFSFLGDVAAVVPLYRLRANPRVAPEQLADVIEEKLAEGGEAQ